MIRPARSTPNGVVDGAEDREMAAAEGPLAKDHIPVPVPCPIPVLAFVQGQYI